MTETPDTARLQKQVDFYEGEVRKLEQQLTQTKQNHLQEIHQLKEAHAAELANLKGAQEITDGDKPSTEPATDVLGTSDEFVKGLEAKVQALTQELHDANIRADPGDMRKFSALVENLALASKHVQDGVTF